MSPKLSLGEFEQLVLLAILHLDGDAYGLAIRRLLEQRTGRQLSRGAVYITLERLESKGFVSSLLTDPSPRRGGRSKRCFRVEPPGVEALRDSRRILQDLWEGLDRVLGEA